MPELKRRTAHSQSSMASKIIEKLKSNEVFKIMGDLMESIACDGCKAPLQEAFVNTCGHSICSGCMEGFCIASDQCIACDAALAPATMLGSRLWGEMSMDVAEFGDAMVNLLEYEKTIGLNRNNNQVLPAVGDLQTSSESPRPILKKAINASAFTQLSLDLLASPPLTAMDEPSQQNAIPPIIVQPPVVLRHHYDSLTQDQSIAMTQASYVLEHHLQQPPPQHLSIAQPSIPTQTSLTDNFDYTPKRSYRTQSQDNYTQGSFGAAVEEIERSKRRIEEYLNAEEADKRYLSSESPAIEQQKVNIVTVVKATADNNLAPFTTPDPATRMMHNNASESSTDSLNPKNATPFYSVVGAYLNPQQERLCRRCVQRGWIQREGIKIHDVTQAMFVTPVIEIRDGYKLTSRSTQYIKCLLLGYLIVDFCWLQDSDKLGSLLDPHDYEIAGSVDDTTFRTPFFSRYTPRENGKIKMLEGYLFTVLPRQCVADKHQLSMDAATDEDLAWLITHSGGNLDDQFEIQQLKKQRQEERFLLKHYTICAAVPSRTPPDSSQGYQGLIISAKWLFDAICNNRIPFNDRKYLIETIGNEWKNVRAIS